MGLLISEKPLVKKGGNQQRMGMGFWSESEGMMVGFNRAESHN
jgi:hypothetical protein